MMEIIRLSPTDKRIAEALALAEKVFTEYDAPLFSAQGADSFYSLIRGSELAKSIADGKTVIYICTEDNITVGMMAVRDSSHISLAFVSHDYQKQGIGSALLEQVISSAGCSRLTVNAAPTGIDFYKCKGFQISGMESITDGIISTPMELKI